MGLINEKPAKPNDDADTQAAPMGGNVLQAAEAKIESQLTPQTHADYMRVVTAGMKLALDKGPNGILAGLAKSQDPLGDCAKGAAGLVVVMYKQSRRTMPVKALIPAAQTLMIKALQFADRTGVIKVGSPELVQATRDLMNILLKQMGITPQMMQTAAGKVHALTKDPVAVEKIKRAAGVVKDPRASTPTLVPGSDQPEQEGGGNGGAD